MTLLDRFRSQPPQKHADPSVRLAFLAGLPIDDRHTIADMAQNDADPRVRRAAVAKLMDVKALATVAESDTDESVRARAIEMLRDIAVEAFEELGESEGLAALEVIGDERVVAQVAKTSARPSVATAALSRLTDSRMLGSIARHAVCDVVRADAVATLRERGDAAELLAVALRSDFKETATAAVDCLTTRAELQQVAARAKNKNAVKRARVLIRERDEADAREAAEQTAAAAEATRVAADAHAQEVRLSMSTEALLHSTPVPVAPAANDLDAAVTEPLLSPDELAPPADAVDAPEADSQAALESPAADAVTATDPATSESAAAEPTPAAGLTTADEPIAAAESVEEGALVAVADPTPADEPADPAARASAIAEAAVLAASLEPFVDARAKFLAARRDWTQLTATAVADEAAAARYAEAEAAFAAREASVQDAEARTRREGLSRMHNLLGRVEQLSAKPDVSLKAADRALRDVRAALASIPPLPSKADYDDVHARLKAVQDVLAPKVNELREADEWQKWANVTIQEQLCAKMEALNELTDAEAIAREVRELQQQWRAAADVPRDKADALWRRFKTAHDTVWAKCEAHFAAEAQARSENLTKKIALCEQAEALAQSTNWIQTAEAIKQLQAEWKSIGPVSRGREKAIWDRFRSACDTFFTRRNADLAQRKSVWAENLARKDELCVRAEALAESTDWDAAAAAIKQLQAEWRTIGPVKKSRSEAIWQRFRGACDKFFERYAHRHNAARAERVAAREAICSELEALAAANEGAEAPADLLSTVRSLRGRWQAEIAARGVDPDRARALDARFADAANALIARWPAAFAGTDLDPDANRKRMEALVKKVEDLAQSLTGPAAASQADLSPVNRLATMLKEALAANTIGGKAEDDSRWRAAAEEVRQAQSAWARLGPVPEPARRQLSDRFQRAVRKLTERGEAGSRQANAGRGAGRPGGRPADRPRQAARPREATPEPAGTEK